MKSWKLIMAKKDDEVTSKRPPNKSLKSKINAPAHLRQAIVAIFSVLALLLVTLVVTKNSVAIHAAWDDMWVSDEPIVTIDIVPVELDVPEVEVEVTEAEPLPVLTPLERTIEDRMRREGKTFGLDCIILAPVYSTELEYGAQRRGCDYSVVPQSEVYYLCVQDIGCKELSEERL